MRHSVSRPRAVGTLAVVGALALPTGAAAHVTLQPSSVAGVSMAWCLVVLRLSPWVTVVGYELHSHQHNAEVIARLSRA